MPLAVGWRVGWRGAGGKSRLALCLSCPRAVIRGAAALAAYARQRDDPDLAVWTAEIRLRAGIRIGELVRELKVSEQAAGGRHDTAVAPTTTNLRPVLAGGERWTRTKAGGNFATALSRS